MKRRSFLQLGAVLVASMANRLYAAKSAMPRAITGLLPALTKPSPPQPEGVQLLDVVAGKTVLLGSRDSRSYFVSVDDIAQVDFLPLAAGTRNALVISAYNRSERGKGGALQRAVLSKLQNLSPDDYGIVDSAFSNDEQMQPGRVFSFQLNIPNAHRSSFPVDRLIVAVFEGRPSGDEGFHWVKPAFEAAEQAQADLLIVPCLGREWRDKRTIQFGDFFGSFFNEVPRDGRPSAVQFSLYGLWPSFELEDAVKSLNAEWNRA